MSKPTDQEAQKAVQILLEYIGEDSVREGLKDTPSRVIKSFKELYCGYNVDIAKLMDKRFHDICGYEDIIMLKDIEFNSVCEHHMLPFSGKVDIAYIPSGYAVGISKIARLVDAFSKRLQIQEKMTAEIAIAMQNFLKPKGVGVLTSATHSCMTSRGSMKGASSLKSIHFTGCFKTDKSLQDQFFTLLAS